MSYSWCVQVNLSQKLLFLHQLTHNMTTDCSLNYKFKTWKFQAQTCENMLCTEIVSGIQNSFYTQHILPRFELRIFMFWTCNSMNNLLLYCGLVGAKIRASDKDLPVLQSMMKQFELLWWIEMIPNMTQMLMRILTNQEQLMLFPSLPYFWLWWHPVIQVLQDQNTIVFLVGCFKSKCFF